MKHTFQSVLKSKQPVSIEINFAADHKTGYKSIVGYNISEIGEDFVDIPITIQQVNQLFNLDLIDGRVEIICMFLTLGFINEIIDCVTKEDGLSFFNMFKDAAKSLNSSESGIALGKKFRQLGVNY